MHRAEQAKLEYDTESIVVPMATVEDSIISKLEGYRLTNKTSERHWDDVNRLRKLHDGRLDVDYLRISADMVGVSDLVLRLINT
jgi:hypothetical protein